MHAWYLQKSILQVSLRAEEKKRREMGALTLHFNCSITVKKQQPFFPKLSCWTEALTRRDSKGKVSGTNTVWGDSRTKQNLLQCCGHTVWWELLHSPQCWNLGWGSNRRWVVGPSSQHEGLTPCQWSSVLKPLSSLGPAGRLVIPLRLGWQLCTSWSNWWYFSRLGFK